VRVGLQGNNSPSAGNSRHPDGAVAAERANLEDASGARHAHQQGQKLPLIGGNVDAGSPARWLFSRTWLSSGSWGINAEIR
jgi:hypothetical protein